MPFVLNPDRKATNDLRKATGVPEMHDRMIVCETLAHGATLITKDETITRSGLVPTGMVGWQVYPFPRILPSLSIVQSPAYNLGFSRTGRIGQPLTRPILRILVLSGQRMAFGGADKRMESIRLSAIISAAAISVRNS